MFAENLFVCAMLLGIDRFSVETWWKSSLSVGFFGENGVINAIESGDD